MMRELLPGAFIIFAVWVVCVLLFLIWGVWIHPDIQLTPLETCTSFCDQAGGELVFVEGPSPLVCSCAIGDMAVDVE